MSEEFDHRVGRATKWFESHVTDDPSGGAGWGWVPDVPPNPQNTAEIVCALTSVGRPIPKREATIELVRRQVVDHAAHGKWEFCSLIDIAWRLRGLRCVVDDLEDRDVAACVTALLDAQVSEKGWSLAGSSSQASVTATCVALRGLFGLAGPGEVEAAVHGGLSMLIDLVLEDDPRTEPIYASAQIVSVLSCPEAKSQGGLRGERAQERALERVAKALRRGRLGIQEETFKREDVTDIWRHVTLCLALTAQADAAPDRVFDPAFRQALIEMLKLQEDRADNINYGGFRTSEEGYVTSYATTQALQALASTKAALDGQANPGSAFDLLCRDNGAHHSDPRGIATFRRRTAIVNSWAGALVFVASLTASLTIAGLTIAFREELGAVASRTLLFWSILFMAGGTFVLAAVLLPETSNRKIAAGVFGVFTALVLPVVFYLFP